VSTNNFCYNASLHDFLSSDANHDCFQARVYGANNMIMLKAGVVIVCDHVKSLAVLLVYLY
jgi:hypothetical protein